MSDSHVPADVSRETSVDAAHVSRETSDDGENWFRNYEMAVQEASHRAAITQLRYRVKYDPANKWWNLTETVIPLHPIR